MPPSLICGKSLPCIDFQTGGYIDVSKYNDGERGGSVKVRAKITKLDNKTLVISEIPYGKTTSTLIESILKANDKGKIKIKKVDDNTARNVEILVHLARVYLPTRRSTRCMLSRIARSAFHRTVVSLWTTSRTS